MEFSIALPSIRKKQFDTRDDVKLWIADNQFGRRDLTTYERSVLALKLKPVIAAKAKENQQLSEGRGQKGCQKSDKAVVDTKKEIAKMAGVSHDTIAKVERIEQQATSEDKNTVAIRDSIGKQKSPSSTKARRVLLPQP